MKCVRKQNEVADCEECVTSKEGEDREVCFGGTIESEDLVVML